MKRITYILLVAIVALISVSCSNYLESDQYFNDRMDLDKVFSSKQYSEQWLAHAFNDLNDECADVASKGHTPHCFADDMYYGDRDGNYDPQNASSLSYNKFRTGTYSENDKQATWEKCYRGIRNATTFIHNIHINKEMSERDIEDYRGQARFVRAYYYWLLLRKYGPIPILPDEGVDYTLSYDEIATPRSSYEDCAEYISKEMVLAAKELRPGRRDMLSIARPTQGAALAARAKALLYAASPLMNGNSDDYAMELVDDQGRQLLSTQYKEEKWAKAAAAARDVIELGVYDLYVANIRTTGGSQAYPLTVIPPYDPEFSDQDWPAGWKNIDPFESYRSIFNGAMGASDNPEIIFTRGQNIGGESGRALVAHQLPRIASGWNTHGITQKQCDAYYMNDGRDCPGKDKEIGRGDGSSRRTGYVETDADVNTYKPLMKGVSLQYAEREPRFYASVAYNGSFWPLENEPDVANRNKQVFYYRGEGNGYSNNMFWLRTGIGVMKFVHPRDTYRDGDIGRVIQKIEPAIRYADILLIYAEALNELEAGTIYTIPKWDNAWNNSGSYTVSRDPDEMKRGIRPVRIRAGLPDYLPAVYADKNEFRKKLKRERQIELMGEGQRYYDLRRWKDAEVEESLPIYGCNALMTGNTNASSGFSQRDLFHIPIAVWALNTSFSRKMWFWPIKHEELKRNKRLTQNPGWTYND
jgi:hypothetical protein